MDIESMKNAEGSLRISQDVIASIAKFATLEIEGVDSVSTANTGVKGLITKTNYLKPIKIELVDDVVNVELNIVVKHGYRIPDLSSQIQQNVKNAIQSMTGLAVARVDIIVAGLAKASDSEAAAE
ncbi:MAG: Asp23/Gls24 family envelope stress response protein [Oscillospiraceae bacterium]|nr:Asp23/Gls24 family envelope stress response protein [Oscillospiraceae bacterium]